MRRNDVMNILIYGAGAVGLGLASCLLKSGHRVRLIAKMLYNCALNSLGAVKFIEQKNLSEG